MMGNDLEDGPAPQLSGKVAVVTGAGTGVGRGIALALAAAGATVVAVGRTSSTVAATVDEVRRRGGRGTALECDVSLRADVNRCIDAVIDEHEALDVVVNAAHDVREGPILATTEDDWSTDWWSGFGGTFHMMQACYPHLRQRTGASIVNLSAATGLKQHAAGLATYAATKEAIRSITRTAAMEWGADGIRVNAVIPLARTERFDAWAAEHPEAFEIILGTIPLGYLGDAETEVGPVVCFLASERSRWVTGTTLMADGGRGYLR
jgi:meso-butanediol dehydrogenase/(S,S)-butanediol dehydrogenase/diacetyl reductase